MGDVRIRISAVILPYLWAKEAKILGTFKSHLNLPGTCCIILCKMMTIDVPTIDQRTRIPQTAIDEIVQKIVEKFQPQKIVLFGSYARGNPHPESDVDLLVVMETPLKESRQSLEIRHYLGVMFGLDLVVYTPRRLQERLEMGDWFLRDILKDGQVVYEANNR